MRVIAIANDGAQ
jgi:hypothetical protein